MGVRGFGRGIGVLREDIRSVGRCMSKEPGVGTVVDEPLQSRRAWRGGLWRWGRT